MEEVPATRSCRARQPVDIWTLWSRAEAMSIVAAVDNFVVHRDCKLFLGSKSNDGYGLKKLNPPGTSGKAAQKNIVLHRLAYRSVTDVPIPEGYHVSHLCGQRACFNPMHLVAESPLLNNSRKGCPGDVVCRCGAIPFECPHRPKCLGTIMPPPATAVDEVIDLDDC